MGQVFTCRYDLYNQLLIQSLYMWLRCIYMQECSVHLLLSSIPMGAINFYLQEYFLPSLIPLLFPWVQRQSLKPVLSQCSKTGFVTEDYFIALYTPSYALYSFGRNTFLHARKFFTLAGTTSIQMLVRFYSHGCNVRA